jgi:hypothetical protein
VCSSSPESCLRWRWEYAGCPIRKGLMQGKRGKKATKLIRDSTSSDLLTNTTKIDRSIKMRTPNTPRTLDRLKTTETTRAYPNRSQWSHTVLRRDTLVIGRRCYCIDPSTSFLEDSIACRTPAYIDESRACVRRLEQTPLRIAQ